MPRQLDSRNLRQLDYEGIPPKVCDQCLSSVYITKETAGGELCEECYSRYNTDSTWWMSVVFMLAMAILMVLICLGPVIFDWEYWL